MGLKLKLKIWGSITTPDHSSKCQENFSSNAASAYLAAMGIWWNESLNLSGLTSLHVCITCALNSCHSCEIVWSCVPTAGKIVVNWRFVFSSCTFNLWLCSHVICLDNKITLNACSLDFREPFSSSIFFLLEVGLEGAGGGVITTNTYVEIINMKRSVLYQGFFPCYQKCSCLQRKLVQCVINFLVASFISSSQCSDWRLVWLRKKTLVKQAELVPSVVE